VFFETQRGRDCDCDVSYQNEGICRLDEIFVSRPFPETPFANAVPPAETMAMAMADVRAMTRPKNTMVVYMYVHTGHVHDSEM
jgi:hypothetical protein